MDEREETDWWWAPNVVSLLSEGMCPEHRQPLMEDRCPTCGCRWELLSDLGRPWIHAIARRWWPNGEPFSPPDGFFASVSRYDG